MNLMSHFCQQATISPIKTVAVEIPTRERIIETLTKHPGQTKHSIRRETKRSESAVDVALNALVSEQVVRTKREREAGRREYYTYWMNYRYNGVMLD